MAKPPTFSILIVNYNGERYLRPLLESIFSQSYSSFEVIVLDNASTDRSLSILRRYSKHIRLIRLSHNCGFSQGNNRAYRLARGARLLLLNNDTYLSDHHLLRNADTYFQGHPQVGVWQPTILLPDGTNDSTGSFFTPSGFLDDDGNAVRPPRPNFEKAVFAVRGAALFARHEVVEQVGLFDEDYFGYVEETDFCCRALMAGWDVRYAPIQGVVHYDQGHVPQKAKPPYFWSIVFGRIFPNQIRTYLKNMDLFLMVLSLPVLISTQLSSALLFSLIRRSNYLFLLLSQYGRIWSQRKEILAKRAVVQSRARRSFSQAVAGRIHLLPLGMLARIRKNLS